MRQTFVEKFSKIYQYPYGHQTASGNELLRAESQELTSENLTENAFERFKIGKKRLRPFHLDCQVSKKRLCTCNEAGTAMQMSPAEISQMQEQALQLELHF